MTEFDRPASTDTRSSRTCLAAFSLISFSFNLRYSLVIAAVGEKRAYEPNPASLIDPLDTEKMHQHLKLVKSLASDKPEAYLIHANTLLDKIYCLEGQLIETKALARKAIVKTSETSFDTTLLEIGLHNIENRHKELTEPRVIHATVSLNNKRKKPGDALRLCLM